MREYRNWIPGLLGQLAVNLDSFPRRPQSALT